MKNKIINLLAGLILGYIVFIYSPLITYFLPASLGQEIIIILGVIMVIFYISAHIFKYNNALNRIADILFWAVVFSAVLRSLFISGVFFL